MSRSRRMPKSSDNQEHRLVLQLRYDSDVSAWMPDERKEDRSGTDFLAVFFSVH